MYLTSSNGKLAVIIKIYQNWVKIDSKSGKNLFCIELAIKSSGMIHEVEWASYLMS